MQGARELFLTPSKQPKRGLVCRGFLGAHGGLTPVHVPLQIHSPILCVSPRVPTDVAKGTDRLSLGSLPHFLHVAENLRKLLLIRAMQCISFPVTCLAGDRWVSSRHPGAICLPGGRDPGTPFLSNTFNSSPQSVVTRAHSCWSTGEK